MGVLLYEMLCGYTPFKASSKENLVENISKAKLKFPKTMLSMPKDLISQILEKNPKKRLSIKKIKEHEWFRYNLKTPEQLSLKQKVKDIHVCHDENNEFYLTSLRKSITIIKKDLSQAIDSNKTIKEKMIDVNIKIREINRTIKLAEQKILKKKIESLNFDHAAKELLEYLADSNVALEKLSSEIKLDELKLKIIEKQDKMVKIDQETQFFQNKFKDFACELESFSENFLDQQRYLSNLQQYYTKLKAKGSFLHRNKSSQVLSLKSSCEFLKLQIAEHEKTEENSETADSKYFKETMDYIKQNKEKLDFNYVVETKLKTIEDCLYIKEHELEQLKNS